VKPRRGTKGKRERGEGARSLLPVFLHPFISGHPTLINIHFSTLLAFLRLERTYARLCVCVYALCKFNSRDAYILRPTTLGNDANSDGIMRSSRRFITAASP